MRSVAYIVVVLVCAALGWQIGQCQVPSAGELETAIYPAVGLIVGAIAGLLVVVLFMR